MTKVVEAIYSKGVLRPLDPLELVEDQHVRLTIESIDGTPEVVDRQAALEQLIEQLEHSTFSHGGPYPSRDALHER